jgi:hypothetical protein
MIVISPWLAFAAGLAIIGYRLLAQRRTRRRHQAPPPRCPRPEKALPAARHQAPRTGSASRDAS